MPVGGTKRASVLSSPTTVATMCFATSRASPMANAYCKVRRSSSERCSTNVKGKTAPRKLPAVPLNHREALAVVVDTVAVGEVVTEAAAAAATAVVLGGLLAAPETGPALAARPTSSLPSPAASSVARPSLAAAAAAATVAAAVAGTATVVAVVETATAAAAAVIVTAEAVVVAIELLGTARTICPGSEL